MCTKVHEGPRDGAQAGRGEIGRKRKRVEIELDSDEAPAPVGSDTGVLRRNPEPDAVRGYGEGR